MLTVVGASWCGWCEKVKNLLTMHDVSFEYIEPATEDLQAMMAPYGVTTIPQVFVGDPRNPIKRIGGYDDTLAWINAGKPM